MLKNLFILAVFGLVAGTSIINCISLQKNETITEYTPDVTESLLLEDMDIDDADQKMNITKRWAWMPLYFHKRSLENETEKSKWTWLSVYFQNGQVVNNEDDDSSHKHLNHMITVMSNSNQNGTVKIEHKVKVIVLKHEETPPDENNGTKLDEPTTTTGCKCKSILIYRWWCMPLFFHHYKIDNTTQVNETMTDSQLCFSIPLHYKRKLSENCTRNSIENDDMKMLDPLLNENDRNADIEHNDVDTETDKRWIWFPLYFHKRNVTEVIDETEDELDDKNDKDSRYIWFPLYFNKKRTQPIEHKQRSFQVEEGEDVDELNEIASTSKRWAWLPLYFNKRSFSQETESEAEIKKRWAWQPLYFH